MNCLKFSIKFAKKLVLIVHLRLTGKLSCTTKLYLSALGLY